MKSLEQNINWTNWKNINGMLIPLDLSLMVQDIRSYNLKYFPLKRSRDIYQMHMESIYFTLRLHSYQIVRIAHTHKNKIAHTHIYITYCVHI